MPLRILGLAMTLALLVALAPLTRAMASQQPAHAAGFETSCDASVSACADACQALAPRGADDLQTPASSGDYPYVAAHAFAHSQPLAHSGSSRQALAGAGPPAYLRYHRLLL